MSTNPAVEEICDAVLRLRGMVRQASVFAAQLSAVRHSRFLLVDCRRHRQLPQPPTVRRPAGRSPSSAVQLSNSDSAVASDFTSTTTGTSSPESYRAVGEDGCQGPPTSMVSNLEAVMCGKQATDQAAESRRHRQLPQLTTVHRPADDDRGHFPASALEPSNTDSRVTSDFTSSTTGTKSSKSYPSACQSPPTSIISDLKAVTHLCDPVVAVVLIALVFFCVACFSYYDENCVSSCERVELWNRFEPQLQLRHIAPPPK